MTKEETEALIQRYKLAYLAANGNMPYEIKYEKGYVSLYLPGSGRTRYRRAEIVEMTKRLELRAKENEPAAS